MSQHLNRLNDKEAIEFEKEFERFCKEENKMKALEKWQESLRQKSPPFRDAFTNKAYQSGQREGWRAALDEVLMQLSVIYTGDFANSEIVEWINKELEEQGGDLYGKVVK